VSLSVGALANQQRATRIGLRTRHGLKGAVRRNRLKRQLRSIISTRRVSFRPGLDVVIVIHPQSTSISTTRLEDELRALCEKTGARS
jgi:ribonuclease P protein component